MKRVICFFIYSAAAVSLSGCALFGQPPVYGEIPECELLIPPSLKAAVPGVPLPETQTWPDGREKAEPWEEGFLGQTGQLDKANERPAAIDYIYHNCLELHRRALKRAQRGFFGRLFG
jgi:hypothetical protein